MLKPLQGSEWQMNDKCRQILEAAQERKIQHDAGWLGRAGRTRRRTHSPTRKFITVDGHEQNRKEPARPTQIDDAAAEEQRRLADSYRSHVGEDRQLSQEDTDVESRLQQYLTRKLK